MGKMKSHSAFLFCAIVLSLSWLTPSPAQDIQGLDHAELGLAAKVAKPVINYFSVAPAGILANQVAILTMSVSGAKSISVTQSPCSSDCYVSSGEATATILLNPTVTTTYTLIATNAGGTVSAKQTVEVGKYNNHPSPMPAGLEVTWGSACWYELDGKEYQAMPYDSQIPTPPEALPIEATLYEDSTTCDGENGTDNLNDFQTAIPSGGWIFWFTRHPGLTGSSAIWTLGNQSSGCLSYEKAPACN
jgi:hypothetical protein